jgi:hypothetical protein
VRLKLADDLLLPPDAVTQTFLIVGKRGSGKSNTAARLVEQFYRAKLPFVVLDPVDTWWGLKAGRNGEKGLDVYVFGGRKADLPLNAGDGALIADVLCEHRASMVLSVKHLSGRERSAFMVKFAQTLFQKWGGGPLHVVLEEAHELAPQMAGRGGGSEDGEAAMLGAFKRLWKLGRASGIGGSAITQRPASLSKDITTQSEILIAHRTIGPQDVAAVGQWVKYHGEKLDILAELPMLPTGEAYIWAPEFPEGKALGLIRTAILLRETYDSASTPKVGEQRVEPKELAAVDLEKLRAKMAATIEKQKADDPRELRKTIERLKAENAAALKKAAPVSAPPPKVVEKPVLKDNQIAALDTAIGRLEKAIDRAADVLTKPFAGVREQLGALAGAVKSVRQPALPMPPAVAEFGRKFEGGPHVEHRRPAAAPPRPPRVPPYNGNGDLHLPPAKQKILNALAWLETIGQVQVERNVAAFIAGISSKSSAYENNVSALRTAGLIEYPGPNLLRLTEEGRAAAVAPDAPPTSQDLHQQLANMLPPAQWKLVDAAIRIYPRSVTRPELAELAGVSAASSAFENNVSRMRTLGLLDYPQQGMVVATPRLFLEGR